MVVEIRVTIVVEGIALALVIILAREVVRELVLVHVKLPAMDVEELAVAPVRVVVDLLVQEGVWVVA